MKNYFFFYLVCLVISGRLKAQESTNINQYHKVGMAESSYFNTSKLLAKGQVTKSISLFSKDMSSYNYRLSLDYDGGNGLKIYNPGSVVGKGWKLDVGGMIVREKRGRVDEDHFAEPHTQGPGNYEVAGYLNVDHVTRFSQLPSDAPYLFNLENGYGTLFNNLVAANANNMDHAQDVFSFSFFGRSGQFKLKRTNGKIEAEIFPSMNLKINVFFQYGYNSYVAPWEGAPVPAISAFSITDEYANTYFFEEADTYGERSEYPEINSWLLKMIIPQYPSLDVENKLKNAIVIDYNKINLEEIVNGKGFGYKSLTKIPEWDSFVENNFTYYMTPNKYMFTPKTIRFPDNTLIKLNYDSKYKSWQGNTFEIGLLQNIEIFEEQNILTSKYEFRYTATSINNGSLGYEERLLDNSYVKPKEYYRWYLKSLDFNGKEINNFEYYHDALANENNLIVDQEDITKSADYYGYPNGDTMRSPRTLSELVLDNKLPNQNYTHMGMLKKINYRAGGYEHFLYEPNLRDSAGVTKIVGGVRLRRHSLIDPGNSMNNRVTEYSYKSLIDTNRSSGFFGNTPKVVKYYHSGPNYPSPINKNYYVVNPFGHNSRFANQVGYSSVTEQEFEYGNSGYELVKATQYEFTDVNDINSQFKPSTYDYPVDIYLDMPLWIVGHLKKKTEFDRNNRIIREEINDYEIFQYQGLKSLKTDLYAIGHTWNETDGVNSVSRLYLAQNYYSVLGKVNLIKKTIRDYDLSNSLNRFVSNVELYSYNEDNQLSVKKIGNNELLANEEYKYTTKYYYKDRLNLPILIEKYDSVKELGQNYIINRLIDAKSYEYAEQPFLLTKDDYKYIYGNDMVSLPSYRRNKIYEARIDIPMTNVPFYDQNLSVQSGRALELTADRTINGAGKVTSETNEFGIKTHYLYDKFQKPIAKFHNGNYEQFMYFSFEDHEFPKMLGSKPEMQGKVNFYGSVVTIHEADAISGRKAVQGELSFQMPVAKYLIKLWAKGNGQLRIGRKDAISGSDASKSFQLTGKWHLYEIALDQVSSNDWLEFSAPNGVMDNILILPEGGEINANTYLYASDPQSGYFKRSFYCQSNGMIVIKDFDNQGRLLNVRDYKGNIIENKVYIEP